MSQVQLHVLLQPGDGHGEVFGDVHNLLGGELPGQPHELQHRQPGLQDVVVTGEEELLLLI